MQLLAADGPGPEPGAGEPRKELHLETVPGTGEQGRASTKGGSRVLGCQKQGGEWEKNQTHFCSYFFYSSTPDLQHKSYFKPPSQQCLIQLNISLGLSQKNQLKRLKNVNKNSI